MLNKLKKINNAYTLATVIFILTFLSIILVLTTFFVSFYLHNANRRLKPVSEWKQFYETLDEIKNKYFEKEIKDNYTSPFDGWFKELPDEIDGYKISCYPEDSKLDINHIEALLFFEVTDASNDKTKSQKKDNITLVKGFEGYLYYLNDLKEYISFDESSDINMQNCLSIFNVPNLNTSGIQRLELFLQSQNYDDNFIKNFIGKIKNYRGAIKDYLKYPLNKTGVKEGLLIDKSEYENLKELNWHEEDSLFKFFDYKGRINLNFVNEKIFEIAFNACSKDKNEDYKDYWDKIYEKRKQGSTITDSDYDKIFGFKYIKVGKEDISIRRWLYYEKIFSVDSNLFKIDIKKNNKVLTAFLRKYKDKELKVKILKMATGVYEEKK